MRCAKCGGKSKVNDYVHVHNPDEECTYRQRICKNCGRIFYTYEYEIEMNKYDYNKWKDNHRRNKKKEE